MTSNSVPRYIESDARARVQLSVASARAAPHKNNSDSDARGCPERVAIAAANVVKGREEAAEEIRRRLLSGIGKDGRPYGRYTAQFEDYCRQGLYEPRFIRRKIERDAIRWEALKTAMLKSGMLANEERRDLSPIERSIKEMQESVRQSWINDLSEGRYDEELKAKREIAAREDENYESMFAKQQRKLDAERDKSYDERLRDEIAINEVYVQRRRDKVRYPTLKAEDDPAFNYVPQSVI
jgi:hypothetical protein